MRISTLLLLLILCAPSRSDAEAYPYAQAGLSEREAAEHLLSRFTFGARPGDVDALVEQGLEAWFETQLEADAPMSALDEKLRGLETLELTNLEIAETYPNPGKVMRMAGLDPSALQNMDRDERRAAMSEAYESMGYRPQREILGQVIAAKVFRAAESPNQLHEVLVDFWFNHLYVSAADNQARRFIGTYERDVIRPHALRSFGEMLEASAKHPAMLLYLDNAFSSAAEGARTTTDIMGRGANDKRPPGINENYARELLELHTLGVDGGYTQNDVEETARALSGWTVLPEGKRREHVLRRLSRDDARREGFVTREDFFFHAGWHDAGPKTILGQSFSGFGGLTEGESVLRMLADHPTTARHVSRKIAVRFVSDEPSEELVTRLARAFTDSRGDTREILRALVTSPEFWASRGDKIKSPLELAVSAVRFLDGTIDRPRELVKWTERMGQPLYRYRAPTGFPDRAEAWIGPGTLVERLNFASALGNGRVGGVRVKPEGADVAALVGAPEFQKR